MSSSEAHTVTQVLTALTTNEQVAACLHRYPNRDRPIERLEADIASQRRELIRELLAGGRANSAELVAARIRRNAALMN